MKIQLTVLTAAVLAATNAFAFSVPNSLTEDTTIDVTTVADVGLSNQTITGSEDYAFDLTVNVTPDAEASTATSTFSASNGGQMSISKVDALTVTSSELMKGAAFYVHGAKTNGQTAGMTLDVGSLTIGTTEANYQGMGLHAMGGTIAVTAKNDVTVRTADNAVWVQQTGSLENGALSIDAKNISIVSDVAAVGAAIYGDHQDGGQYNKTSLKLNAAETLAIESLTSSALSANDTYETTSSQGQIDIDLAAGSALALTGATNAVSLQRLTQTDSQTGLKLNAPTIEVTAKNGAALKIAGNAQAGQIVTTITADNTTLSGTTAIDSKFGDIEFAAKTAGTAANVNVYGDVVVSDGTLKLNQTALHVEDASTVRIDALEGGDQAVITFAALADDEDLLTIGQNTSKETKVSFDATAIDGLSAEEAAERLRNGVHLGTVDGTDQGAAASGTIEGNGTNFTVTVDENGSTRVEGSDITKQTADLAAMTLVAWRNETTTITDRMASLRTNPQTYGAWVRWNGGAYDFDDRDLSNDFNTIEVGGDMKIDPNWVLGASFSYTKGDGDFMQGETESDAYAGALYALWTHEKGSFVDMVMKAGRISTDFDFYNLQGGATDHGTLDQTGFILSVETGHRFALPMNTFVEPQIQLQYSRLASVDETTAARQVDLDASSSLIGRIGVMAGLECPNDRGTVWLKASALRDFKGDVDGMVANADGTSAYAISEELDQSWAELALGADVKVTDNVYAFADVQKSFGGDIELDWRANVGAKIVW